MAISWGAWERSGGNGMRVGIDVSWENISHGESAATATIDIYTENQFTYGDGQSLNFGGAIGGSTSFNNNAGGSPVKRATKKYTYTYGNNEYGSSPGNRTFSASLSGAYNGVTPSKSVTSSIPARPIAAPDAPGNVTVSRVNDSAQKITWNNKSTAGEPWEDVDVDRDVNGNGNWSNVSKQGGGSTSATDSNTSSNTKYRYRVRAQNGAGNSPWVQTGLILTSPAAPTNCVRSAGTGAQQVVTWSNTAGYPEYQTEVWVARNGSWSLLAAVSSGVNSHTDTAASASNQLKYRVRHRTTDGVQGTLNSAWSGETSETPGITSPPLAPTGLSPSGLTVDPTVSITFGWTHNPTDGTVQAKREVRHRAQGEADWVHSGQSVTASTSYALPIDSYDDGEIVEWQVRTWGADPDPSPWSASATFNTAVAPIAEDPIRLPVLMNLETGQLEASSSASELRDIVMRIQANVMGGGTRSVSATYGIKWTNRFVAINLGRSANTFPNGLHDIDMPKLWTVSNKSISSNVATLTVTTSDMKMRPGETITVAGVGAPYDGSRVVRSIYANRVRFDCIAPDQGSTAASGSISPRVWGRGGAANVAVTPTGTVELPVWQALYYELPFGWGSGTTARKNGVVRCSNKAKASGTATLTLVAPHYFVMNDRISVSIGDPDFDGVEFRVTDVGPTHVSYSFAGADVASTPVGSTGRVSPTGKDTFLGNFRIVSHTSDFVVPETWVMIALRNNDSATVEWCNGDVVDPGFDSTSPVFKQAILSSTTDVNTSAGNTPALRVGSPSLKHLRMDGNEIQAMDGDSTPGKLLINQGGGEVQISNTGGGPVTVPPNLIAEASFDNPGAPTGSFAANVNMNPSGGRLRRDTSSRRYKRNEHRVSLNVEDLLSLVPKAFQRNDEEGGVRPDNPWYYGFIAEDAADLGLHNWVVRDDSGLVDGFAYDKWVVALQAVCQSQQNRINDLEARLSALEERE